MEPARKKFTNMYDHVTGAEFLLYGGESLRISEYGVLGLGARFLAHARTTRDRIWNFHFGKVGTYDGRNQLGSPVARGTPEKSCVCAFVSGNVVNCQ